MWSVTNYFLLNLTISDIMMATLNTPVSFIYMRDRLDFREGKFNKEAFKTQMFIKMNEYEDIYGPNHVKVVLQFMIQVTFS